jgi:pilus assembly protein Flp/PilA
MPPSGHAPTLQTHGKGRWIMNKILAFLLDETGASAAEYALILAIVGGGIAAAMLALGADISAAIGAAGDAINPPP